jgi:hypothetical protein
MLKIFTGLQEWFRSAGQAIEVNSLKRELRDVKRGVVVFSDQHVSSQFENAALAEGITVELTPEQIAEKSKRLEDRLCALGVPPEDHVYEGVSDVLFSAHNDR